MYEGLILAGPGVLSVFLRRKFLVFQNEMCTWLSEFPEHFDVTLAFSALRSLSVSEIVRGFRGVV